MSAALNGWQALKQGELHPFPNVMGWAGMRRRVYALGHRSILAYKRRGTNSLICYHCYAKVHRREHALWQPRIPKMRNDELTLGYVYLRIRRCVCVSINTHSEPKIHQGVYDRTRLYGNAYVS